MQSIATKIIPWVLRRFPEESPEVAVTFEETNDPRALMQAVLSGELYLPFMALTEPVDDTFQTAMVCVRSLAVAPSSFPIHVVMRRVPRRIAALAKSSMPTQGG
jgi:hypothetical protein